MSLDSLLRQAEQHLGLLRLSDATEHEVPRHRLDRLRQRGVIELVGESVFRVRGAPRSWEQSVLAACWQVGPQALASHRTATAMFDLRLSRRSRIEVLVPRGAGGRPAGVTVHETRHLTGADLGRVGVIPTTSPERTIIDMAGLGPLKRTETMLDDAVHRNLTNPMLVASRLAEMPTRGRRGAKALRRLLVPRLGGEVHANAWENLMNRLLAGSDLPEARRQWRVVCGEHTYYLDFAFVDYRVAVECDSLQEHSSPSQYRHDLDRQHRIEDQGWVFRRFLRSQAEADPNATVERIRRSMVDRGWTPPRSLHQPPPN